MVNIGDRLKEERERLRMTQESFSVAGGAGKRAYIRYEQGERLPDAGFLAALSASGVDVLYVLTGRRSATALSPEEQTLLAYYRDAPAAVRRAAMGALVGGAQPGGMTMTQSGGGVQVGQSGGPVTVGAPAPRKRKTG